MTKRYVQKREDKRPDDLPPGSNWLNDPAGWDICDAHETAFPMGQKCPQCSEPCAGCAHQTLAARGMHGDLEIYCPACGLVHRDSTAAQEAKHGD